MNGKKELLETVENIGLFMQYWGFKSVHGKIWAYIYISEEPVSTPQIVEFLGVSKGLVSVAINELLEYKLIIQAEKTKYGALTYLAPDNPAATVREVLKHREINILSEVENSLNSLSKLNLGECKNLNLSKDKTKNLLELTSAHKKLLTLITKRNINSITEWRKFLDRGLKFLKLKV